MTITRAFHAWLADLRGAVAIEFAAIAVPLMLLLGGTIETSRFVWTRLALQDAAMAGARCLGLQVSPCYFDGAMDSAKTVELVLQQAADWAVSIPAEAVTPEAGADCLDTLDFARLEIRFRFTSVIAPFTDTWIDVDACFPVMPSD